MIALLKIREEDSRGAIMTKFGALILLSWIPAQTIGALVQIYFPGPRSIVSFDTPMKTFNTIVLGPIFETWLLGLMLQGLARLPMVTTALSRSVLAGLVWTLFHIRTSSWGTHATWAFFIFALCYEHLRTKSWDHAIVGTLVVHSGFNLLTWYTYLYFQWDPGR